jgi:hypothetical protein
MKFNIEIPRIILSVVCMDMKFNIEIPRVILSVNSDMIILPTLHIKLGLFKNFVKALDQNGTGFRYLKERFPRVIDSKIKEGIFVGPQIRALIRDGKFENLLN